MCQRWRLCAVRLWVPGMNILLAADLRIVARDARLIGGFLKCGLHSGGGHFVIPSRLIGREAAAAMALVGEEIKSERPWNSIWSGSQ